MEKVGIESLGLDKIFCINLERRPDRRESTEAVCKQLGITPVFFNAVDGQSMNLVHDNGKTPGMLGCYLSHFMLLQHCLLSGYEKVLILEDDIEIILGGKALLSHALPSLPKDWQFAYLGYTHLPDQRGKEKKVNDYWCVPAGCWGTQAYMINGREAMEIIYNALKKPKAQIDIDLSYTILPRSGLKYYGITPSCLRQTKGRSDVQ